MSKQYPDMKIGSPDDFQTPATALDCLIPFVPKDWTIWEPACGNGNLVMSLIERGFHVIGTDIKLNGSMSNAITPVAEKDVGGVDFLKTSSPCGGRYYDMILTNPPFSIKDDFLARCYMLQRPFALLMPISTFDSANRRKMMKACGVQVIMPPGRINFETPNHEANVVNGKKTSSWFYTAWFCRGLDLPSQIVFTD